MAKAVSQQSVISANRLRDGAVVFVGPGGDWVEQIAEAVVFGGEELTAALDRAKQSERDNSVVEAYGVEVVVHGAIPVPARTRERMRALGPSVRLDLGKQAAGAVLPEIEGLTATSAGASRSSKS
jgi:sulfite reductase (NADPH) hemoprotein beta-component